MAQTKAGQAGGWYNVQDFLAANPAQANSQKYQDKADKQLSEAKAGSGIYGDTGAETSWGASDIAEHVAKPTGWGGGSVFQGMRDSGGGLDQGELSQIGEYMGQSEPQQENVKDIYKQNTDPFAGMKAGDMSSIAGWYGQDAARTGDTPGMQKMDEFLLRGDKDFSKNFATQQQDKFKSQVSDKAEGRRQDITSAREATRGDQNSPGTWEASTKDWREGISNFLGDQQYMINARAENDKYFYDANVNRSDQSLMPTDDWRHLQKYKQYDPSAIDESKTYQRAGLEGIDPRKYFTLENSYAPTQAQAATAAIGNQGIDAYNALSNYLGGTDTRPGGYGAYGKQDPWKAGNWNFDREQYETDYMDLARREGEYDYRTETDRIAALGNTKIGSAWGRDARAFVEDYEAGNVAKGGIHKAAYDQLKDREYKIPGVASTPYGEVDLTGVPANQKGQYYYGKIVN